MVTLKNQATNVNYKYLDKIMVLEFHIENSNIA